MEPLERITATQLPNTLGDEPPMSQTEYTEAAKRASEPLSFATSQSGVPAPFSDPRLIQRIVADSFRLAGMTSSDGQLNAAAPHPHLSGWAANLGAADIGATILNDDFSDWQTVIEEGRAGEATVIASLPSKALDVGQEVVAAYGPPNELFPNLRVGHFTGQVFRPSVRAELKAQWGLDTTREFYGSSESVMIAVAVDETRRLIPLLNHHILELEVDDDIVDIRDVNEVTEGSLLITTPARSALTLRRYRQGDWVRIYPDDPLPRITPLGRADEAIDFDGALVHPEDLFDAIADAFPVARNAVVFADDRAYPTTVEVFLEGVDQPGIEQFYAALSDRQPALRHALGERPHERIEVSGVEDISALPFVDDSGLKSTQIVFATDKS